MKNTSDETYLTAQVSPSSYCSSDGELKPFRKTFRLTEGDSAVDAAQNLFIGCETDDANFPLTQHEAFNFLTTVLSIENVVAKVDGDRLSLLNEITARFNHVIPWTSIGLFNSFRMPSFQDLKDMMFQRFGGNCTNNNMFLKVLLDRLGFETYFFECCIKGIFGFHLGVAVKNVTKPGSLHVVDGGLQFPLLEAIPMDFEHESPVYHHIFLKHKYIKRKDGLVDWLHAAVPGNLLEIKFSEKYLQRGWFVHMSLDCYTPSNLRKHYQNLMNYIVLSESNARYRGQPVKLKVMIGGQFVVYQEGQIVRSLPNGKLEFQKISVDQFKKFVKAHMPDISTKEIEGAISNREFADAQRKMFETATSKL